MRVSNVEGGAEGMNPDGLIESNWDQVVDSFDDMNLDQQLLRGIYGYGFEKPSAIQMRAIVPCTKGHDVIAQAQSGTGKTATFAISCLQNIDVNRQATQALILGPTRELAQQIQKVCFASFKLTNHNAGMCNLIHEILNNCDLATQRMLISLIDQ